MLPWILVAVLALFLAITLLALRRYEKPLEEVSRRAEARVPSTIRLERIESHAWRDPDLIAGMTNPLLAHGFVNAGDFQVVPIKGIVVRLLTHAGEAMYACIYEYPRPATSMEIVSRYRDRTIFTCTNSPDRGVEHRPGIRIVHLTGADAETLYGRMVRERPRMDLMPVDSATVTGLFEDLYASDEAWPERRGGPAAEVGLVPGRP